MNNGLSNYNKYILTDITPLTSQHIVFQLVGTLGAKFTAFIGSVNNTDKKVVL